MTGQTDNLPQSKLFLHLRISRACLRKQEQGISLPRDLMVFDREGGDSIEQFSKNG